MLIDAHAHLCDDRFKEDAEEIADRTRISEPSIIVDSGVDITTSRDCFARANRHSGVYCAVGTHPENAYELTDDILTEYAEMWKSDKTVAIGEIGLDYHYPDNPSKEAQKETLLRQLKLADELRAPVVLHVRDAHGDMLEILKANSNLVRSGVLVHCYSGSKELVCEYNKFGSYFSYGGAITFKNAHKKKEVVQNTPIDKILTETDCPYLAPEPMRGRRNEPSYVKYVIAKIAEYIEKSVEETEVIVQTNAFNLFAKMKK